MVLIQAPTRLRIHVHPGETISYVVTAQGHLPSSGRMPRNNVQKRHETYKLQTIGKNGIFTFHTSLVVYGGPHGPTRGNGEQQLESNAEPPGGITSYIFDNDALADLSYPKGELKPGQSWSTPVISFGKSNAGKFSYTYKGEAVLNGIRCAKIDVWAGTTDNPAGIVGTGTYWISLSDGLPVKKSLVQHFGNRWTTTIDVIRNR